jgi:hypothetical protein
LNPHRRATAAIIPDGHNNNNIKVPIRQNIGIMNTKGPRIIAAKAFHAENRWTSPTHFINNTRDHIPAVMVANNKGSEMNNARVGFASILGVARVKFS